MLIGRGMLSDRIEAVVYNPGQRREKPHAARQAVHPNHARPAHASHVDTRRPRARLGRTDHGGVPVARWCSKQQHPRARDAQRRALGPRLR